MRACVYMCVCVYGLCVCAVDMRDNVRIGLASVSRQSCVQHLGVRVARMPVLNQEILVSRHVERDLEGLQHRGRVREMFGLNWVLDIILMDSSERTEQNIFKIPSFIRRTSAPSPSPDNLVYVVNYRERGGEVSGHQ